MSAVVLTCVAARLAAADAVPLRLVGTAAGAEFSDVVVEKHELRVRTPDGTTQPIPRGTRWRLDGDLRTEAGALYFLPNFNILTRPALPLRSEATTRTYAIVRCSRDWPWSEANEIVNTVIVFAWLVDGQVTRVLPVAERLNDGPSQYIAGIVAFELTEAERRGCPVVLVRKKDRWLPLERWFPEEAVEAAFVDLHLNPGSDVGAALAEIKPARRWTRLRGRPFLYMAARGGFAEGVRSLLEHGTKPGERTTGDSLALHGAAENGYADVCELLLAAGVPPLATNSYRWSSLEYAVCGGHLAIASRMLGEKPRQDFLNDTLELAFEHGDIARVRELLARGGDRIVRKLEPETFGPCLQLGDVELVRELLQLRVKADREGMLVFAAASGQPGNVEQMLHAGARVDRATDDGTTALVVATSRGDLATTRVLLEAGANPNHVNKVGESPLQLAAAHGHHEVVDLLRARGATETGTTRDPRKRHPKLRWVGDLLRSDGGPVFAADDVDLPPVDRSSIIPEVVRGLSATFGGGTPAQSYYTDPVTGQTIAVNYTQHHSTFAPESSGSTWAVIAGVVEVDGSLAHAQVIDASSGDFALAVDKVLERFEFEPGENNGQAVRTRVTAVITVEK